MAKIKSRPEPQKPTVQSPVSSDTIYLHGSQSHQLSEEDLEHIHRVFENIRKHLDEIGA